MLPGCFISIPPQDVRLQNRHREHLSQLSRRCLLATFWCHVRSLGNPCRKHPPDSVVLMQRLPSKLLLPVLLCSVEVVVCKQSEQLHHYSDTDLQKISLSDTLQPA